MRPLGKTADYYTFTRRHSDRSRVGFGFADESENYANQNACVRKKTRAHGTQPYIGCGTV